MDFDLNKREFRDAIRLRYDWAIPNNQSVRVCCARFTTDHAMIRKRGGLLYRGITSCETWKRRYEARCAMM